MRLLRVILTWGLRPQTPGIYRIIARIGGVASQLEAPPPNPCQAFADGRRVARLPAIPAAGSALGSHPCVALSSAQVFPGWTISTSSRYDFSSNGDYPLNFLSRPRGSLQRGQVLSSHLPRQKKADQSSDPRL
jgi:hypothetical protein